MSDAPANTPPAWGPPVVSQGLVFSVSVDGRLYSFRADTGEAAWESQIVPGFSAEHLPGPAIYGGYLYVGTVEGTISYFSLDVEDSDDRLIREQRVSGRIVAPLITACDSVYYAGVMNPGVGMVGMTNLPLDHVWQQNTDGPVVAAPVVAEDGSVFVITQTGTLYGFDRTGEPLWQPLQIGTAAYGGLAMGEEEQLLYALAGNQEGTLLHGVEYQTGKISWHGGRRVGALAARGGPSLSAGEIIVGDSNTPGYLNRFSRGTGKPLPPVQVGGQVVVPPVISGTMLYAADSTGNFWRFDLRVGSNREHICELPDASPKTPTAVSDGALYFGGGNGALYALAPPDRQQTGN